MSNSNNNTTEIQLLKSELEVAQKQYIKQKEINKAVLAVQEKERTKIIMEIQENLNQLLIAALLYIELAETDHQIREICLKRSSSFISIAVKELSRISRTLTVKDVNMKLVNM